MTLAFVVPLMFATCDLGEVFSKPDAWVTSAVDFAAEHRNDGFRFASQKQDIVNCMGRGKCTWHGLEVWEARVYFGTDGATRVEMSMYNRGDDRSHDGLGADELQKLLDSIAAGAQPGGKIGSGTDRKKLRNGGFRMSKRWTNGYCNVELDWGVDGAKKENLTADFVRVTMYPKGASKPKKIPKEGVAGLVDLHDADVMRGVASHVAHVLAGTRGDEVAASEVLATHAHLHPSARLVVKERARRLDLLVGHAVGEVATVTLVPALQPAVVAHAGKALDKAQHFHCHDALLSCPSGAGIP